MKSSICLLTLLLCCASFGAEPTEQLLANWHQFRGPLASGVAPQGDPPTRWSDTQNVRWKVEIPGVGSSTPIVWNDRIFLLTAIETDRVSPDVPPPAEQPKRPFGIVFPHRVHQFVVLCLNRADGTTLWQQVATEVVPHEGHHPDNDFASSTPITDGQRVYVSFGSRGLYCYDLAGRLKWQRQLGQMQTRLSFGEGSSPALHDGVLVTTWDHEGPSFIVALDAATGEEVWRQTRDEQSDWATPLIVERDGSAQVITNASKRVRSYDLKSGRLLWECGGQVGNVTPSPVTAGNLVFCMSGYRGNALLALPLDQRGDLTGSDKIAWQANRGTPYIPCPLLYDDRLYFTQANDGIFSCLKASTGETVIDRTRLPGISRIYSSPVAAANRIYITSRDGVTLVLKHADQFEVLATNRLDDPIDASPAIAGKELFLRGQRRLYCLAEQ
jgi:outer membrane protein assembly factor BamB